MVTIKRVMRPNTSESTVTISVKKEENSKQPTDKVKRFNWDNILSSKWYD